MPNLNQKRLSGSIKNAGGSPTESSLLPVVPWMTAALEERELRRLEETAAQLAKQEPALAATQAFGPHTRSGVSPHLWLVIGDTREIAAPDSRASACPLSGRNSTYRAVRNCGATSYVHL